MQNGLGRTVSGLWLFLNWNDRAQSGMMVTSAPMGWEMGIWGWRCMPPHLSPPQWPFLLLCHWQGWHGSALVMWLDCWEAYPLVRKCIEWKQQLSASFCPLGTLCSVWALRQLWITLEWTAETPLPISGVWICWQEAPDNKWLRAAWHWTPPPYHIAPDWFWQPCQS